MLDKILRMGEGRKAKQLQKIVDAVNDLGPSIEPLSDAELKAKTDEFKARLADGASLDDLQAEVFAVVREAAWRILGERPVRRPGLRWGGPARRQHRGDEDR
jgi:preprotein translocase subunit SecA